MSAALASRRARTSPSAANAVMNCVPLTSESPSFAWSRTGSRPTDASASLPGIRSPSTDASPSPTSGRARCARGARSPLAPTDPRLGTCGRRPRLRHSISSSTVATRAPEKPFASAFARSSMAARTTSSGYGSPTPQAWLRSRRSWSSSDSSKGIVFSTKRPKPVLIPYVCSPAAPLAARSTRALAARIFSRPSSERCASAPSQATAHTSDSVRSSPVSDTPVVSAIGASLERPEGGPVRVHVISDIEGVSGVVKPEQGDGGESLFEEACRLYTEEINAAIRGARAAGADEIVVMDCHGAGQGWSFNSLLPEELDPDCEYVVQNEWTEYVEFLERGV